MAFLVVLLSALPLVANAGVIRGVVTLRAAHRKFTRIGNESGGAVKRRLEGVDGAVVFLDSIPNKIERQLAKKATEPIMVQRRARFIPRTLCVTVGTTVAFLNRDRVYHSVFSVAPAGKFDLGKYAPGTTRRQTFGATGAIELFCELDSGESGYIFVAPNHACSQVTSSGVFALPKLPPGRYQLTAWHPAYGTQTREIQMPKRGDVVVELEF
jgi:plastocyanin